MNDMDNNNQHPLARLYSGEILRYVVQALDTKDEVLDSRTARRFFAGEPKTEYNRAQIFEALGQALIQHDIAPESLDALPDGVSPAMAIGMAVGLVGERWDHLMATVQSRGATVVDVGAVGERFLRLVAVDLAVRLFALNRLTGFPLPDPELPLWAQENGGGRVLRHHLHRSKLSRHTLAARLGASYTTIDNWLDGKNWPSHAYVTALAQELAPSGIEPGAKQFERQLRRELAFARLADLLAASTGRDAVAETLTAAMRFAQMLSESIGFPLSREESAGYVELRLLLFGCLEHSAQVLLWRLAKLEADPDWRRDLLAAAEPWEFHFEHIAAMHSRSSAAGLSQDILDVVDDVAELDLDALTTIRRELRAEANAWDSVPPGEGGPHLVLDPLQDGIARRRSLVRRFPHSPEAHYQLGSFLGMAGKNLRARELADEGIVECKIAAGLLPNWDGPAVECGIILTNIGEHAAALRELEQAQATLSEATPHLRFVTGYVLLILERYSDALEHLKTVTEVRPDFASAHRYAAQCAFKLGYKSEGARHAKASRQLGDFTEWMAWQDGAYSSRGRGRAGTSKAR